MAGDELHWSDEIHWPTSSVFKENNYIFKLSQLLSRKNNGCFPQFFNCKYKFSRDSVLYRIGSEIKLQKFVYLKPAN